MTPAIAKHSLPMDGAALRRAAALCGPCISLIVPAARPGTAEGEPAQMLRSLIRSAAGQVATSKLGEVVPLLKRLEEFAADISSHPLENNGFVLFCSPEVSARYENPRWEQRETEPRVIIASYPELKPFIDQAYRPPAAVVICLSRKALRLFEYAGGACHQLALPRGVPAGLQEAGSFDKPEHRLENRSSAGPSVGTMGGVSFGTSSDREKQSSYEEHYFAMIDRGIRPLLNERPVILAGVHEEIAAYRRVSLYENLLAAELTGNWDFKSEAELTSAVNAILTSETERLATENFEHFEHKLERTRTLTDPHEILVSAADGRVHQLFVRRGGEFMAKLPPDLDRARLANEDFVNASASETLRHGGEVFELAPAELPELRPLAAILRY